MLHLQNGYVLEKREKKNTDFCIKIHMETARIVMYRYFDISHNTNN